MNHVLKFWNGHESFARAFWLWGIAGNASYIILFLIWPLHLISLLGSGSPLGLILGGMFICIAQSYMLFSFIGGARTARRQASAKLLLTVLSIFISILLLVIGEMLWALFGWFLMTQALTATIWQGSY